MRVPQENPRGRAHVGLHSKRLHQERRGESTIHFFALFALPRFLILFSLQPLVWTYSSEICASESLRSWGMIDYEDMEFCSILDEEREDEEVLVYDALTALLR